MLDLPLELSEIPALIYEAQYVQYTSSGQFAECIQLALLDDTTKKDDSRGKLAKNKNTIHRESKNDTGQGKRRPFFEDTQITDSQEVNAEIKKARSEYKKRFGRDVEFYSSEPLPTNWSFGLNPKDTLTFLLRALKMNKPYEERRVYVWARTKIIARYELHFGKSVPDCRYATDACKENPSLGFGEIDTTDCRCQSYLTVLLSNALYNTNEPLPERIIVTKLDLWKGIYSTFTGKETFPVWFDTSSYEDKVIYLKNTIGNGMPWFGSYLSRKEEDAIRVELAKDVTKKEKELGRKMTALEKTITEFEIQFGEQIPMYTCSDGELLIYLNFLIKYNKKWYTPGEPITKDHVQYITSGEWWEDVKRKYK